MSFLHPFDLALMLPSLPTPLRAADSQGLFAWPGQDQGYERESQPKVPGRVRAFHSETCACSQPGLKSPFETSTDPPRPLLSPFPPSLGRAMAETPLRESLKLHQQPPSISECQAVKGKGAVGEEGETNFAIHSHTG